MIREAAPAKINLWLHVGPVRADGLHAIESLFVFAEDGDIVSAAPARELTLAVEGPFASALSGFPVESNLVFKAASLLKKAARVKQGAALTLDKRLPVAAGIGGGSADAAAALRALVRLWRLDISEAMLARLAFSLGADVPACLARAPVYVGGAGEVLAPGPSLPPLWACLVNPGVETPTGPIFRAFDLENPAPAAPLRLRPSRLATLGDVKRAFAASRNDLEPYAAGRENIIGSARKFLAESPGAIFSRMSGSGATVFALYGNRPAAARAARRAAAKGWWSLAAKIASGGIAPGAPAATSDAIGDRV